MNLYDVEGYDRPLLLSPEHAEAIGATLHQAAPRPKANASLADWSDYAVGRGVDPVLLEGLSRADVITLLDTHYPADDQA